jgi:hypothetical protein
MAYNNALVVNRLYQRGLLIKSEKWDKVNKKNEQILKEIHDPKELDKLQTVVSIFATFESEEGYQRARYFNHQDNV